MNGERNADRLQTILNDDLFPKMHNVSDVKQVLEFMEHVAQPVSEAQIRAVILLESLGTNERLHGEKNPYTWLIDRLVGKDGKTGIWKKAVAPTSVYLDTMEELIPKPPKPVILAPGPIKGGK